VVEEEVVGLIHLLRLKAEQVVGVMVLTMETQMHQQQVQIILEEAEAALVLKVIIQVMPHKLQAVQE
jgi:hypothetical protein